MRRQFVIYHGGVRNETDRRPVVRRAAGIGDRTSARSNQLSRNAEERRFTRAVAPGNRHALAGSDVQRQIPQRINRAISLFHLVELQSDGGFGRGRQGLASDQLSQHLFSLGPFARVLFFADGSCLVAQFQAEQLIF